MRLYSTLTALSAGLIVTNASNVANPNKASVSLATVAPSAAPSRAPLDDDIRNSTSISALQNNRCAEEKRAYIDYCQQFLGTHRQECLDDADIEYPCTDLENLSDSIDHLSPDTIAPSPSEAPSDIGKIFQKPKLPTHTIGIISSVFAFSLFGICAASIMVRSYFNHNRTTSTESQALNSLEAPFEPEFKDYDDLEEVPEGAPDASNQQSLFTNNDYTEMMDDRKKYQPIRIVSHNEDGTLNIGHQVMEYHQLKKWVKAKKALVHPLSHNPFKLEDIRKEVIRTNPEHKSAPATAELPYGLATNTFDTEELSVDSKHKLSDEDTQNSIDSIV